MQANKNSKQTLVSPRESFVEDIIVLIGCKLKEAQTFLTDHAQYFLIFAMLFQLAAKLLQEETDKWEEENNSIVKVAKEMAQQMMQMAKFARRRNRVQVRASDVILR